MTEPTSRRHKIKLRITESVITELGDSQLTLEQAMREWWLNIRQSGGFRLTPQGDVAFTRADIEHFTFEVFKKEARTLSDKVNVLQFMLDIDKYLDVPYYFYRGEGKRPHLRVYDEGIAIMASLYGTVEEYIESVKQIRKK